MNSWFIISWMLTAKRSVQVLLEIVRTDIHHLADLIFSRLLEPSFLEGCHILLIGFHIRITEFSPIVGMKKAEDIIDQTGNLGIGQGVTVDGIFQINGVLFTVQPAALFVIPRTQRYILLPEFSETG